MRIAWLQIETWIGETENIRLPLLVQHLSIQIVMVVASFGDDVEEIVIGVDDRISLVHHIHRVGPAIIPVVNDNIGVYLHVTLHLCQTAPHSGSLPFAPQVSIIGVYKLPVMAGIAWRVLIRAYIYLPAIKPWKELVPDSIHEGVGVGVIQVKILF